MDHHHLLLCEPHGDGLVDEVECHDEDEVDGGPGGCYEDGPVTPANKASEPETLSSHFIRNQLVRDCGEGHDHGHSVEDDGDDCDQGEEDEEEDTGPGNQNSRHLHPPEGRPGLGSLGHEVDVPLLHVGELRQVLRPRVFLLGVWRETGEVKGGGGGRKLP